MIELLEDYLVLDGLVPLDLSNQIEDYVFKKCPLTLGDNYKSTTSLEGKNIHNVYEQFQFGVSVIEEYNSSNVFINLESFILSPLVLALSKLNIILNRRNVLRCKINLQTKSYKNIKDKYNMPHIDNIENPSNLITVIYYVNDSDGDTYIFDKKLKGGDLMDEKKLNNISIKHTIPPKKGRILLFKGENLHAGIHPSNSMFRSVINYNYKI